MIYLERGAVTCHALEGGALKSNFTCDGYHEIEAHSLVAFMFGQFNTV